MGLKRRAKKQKRWTFLVLFKSFVPHVMITGVIVLDSVCYVTLMCV